MRYSFLRVAVIFAIMFSMPVSVLAGQPPMLRQSSEKEVKGVWIATVTNLHWPSKSGLSAEQQKAEAITILDKAKLLGLNMIVFQVRPTGDAFYKSDYFPWSRFLTGTQGKDPGYDPLAFWIDESHKRGMDLHAWINPYRLSMNGGDTLDLSQFSTDHPAHKHPDWIIAYVDKKIYFDPGIPECRKYIVAAGVEIAKKYDVDGIHIDDYFYPYPVSVQEETGKRITVSFPDDKSFTAYGSEFIRENNLQNVSKEEQRNAWRRNNVNLMIKELYEGIRNVKPEAQFGISPFGIWRNKSNDPSGSETSGLQSYDALHADTKFWIENGCIDYVTPQLYWYIGFRVADYEKLLRWWSDLIAKNPNVRLYVGQAAHRVGSDENTPWKDCEEIVRQIKMNRSNSFVTGQILFGWPTIASNKLGLADVLKTLFAGEITGQSSYDFKEGAVSVYLSPSLQPGNIGVGDYGSEERRMHELTDIIEPILLRHGVTVYRNKIGMSLREAVADSNAKEPTIHVAIHSNAFRQQTRGVETFHKAEGTGMAESIRLATRLYEALLKIYDGPRRGVKPTSTLYEPRSVEVPNTLIEVAFHDNETDSKWILDNMQLIGETLAEGILLHLAAEHPDALNE